jgi:hypothetical protein
MLGFYTIQPIKKTPLRHKKAAPSKNAACQTNCESFMQLCCQAHEARQIKMPINIFQKSANKKLNPLRSQGVLNSASPGRTRTADQVVNSVFFAEKTSDDKNILE